MVLKKQQEMAAVPGTTAAAATSAASSTSAMDAVAKMFGSATPSSAQIAVVREARDKTVAAATGPTCPPAGHSAADAVAAMFGSATPDADAIAPKLRETMARRANTSKGPSSAGSAAGSAAGAAAESAAEAGSAAGAAAPVDEAVVAKLEADYKSFQLTFAKLRDELSDANQRISIVEKFSGLESKLARRTSSKEKKRGGGDGSITSAKSAAESVVPAVSADGTVTIAKCDSVLVMLQAYLGAGLNVKVKVDSKAAVSSYADSSGTKVEGATAVLSTVASGMVGSTPVNRALVQEWCGWGEAGKGDDLNVKSFLGQLDAHLAGAVYIAGFDLTIADLICFTTVRSYLRDKSGSDREEMPHLSRWFNCVQHCKGLVDNPIFFCANALNWRVAEHA